VERQAYLKDECKKHPSANSIVDHLCGFGDRFGQPIFSAMKHALVPTTIVVVYILLVDSSVDFSQQPIVRSVVAAHGDSCQLSANKMGTESNSSSSIDKFQRQCKCWMNKHVVYRGRDLSKPFSWAVFMIVIYAFF
jgi:hypothetical protein